MGGNDVFFNNYDRGLKDIRTRVENLVLDVHKMLNQSLASLFYQDAELAEAVIGHDDVVDEETLSIEEDTLQLMSLQQPRQKDLRTFAASLRIVRDLERIADYACDIAETTQVLAYQPYFKQLEDLPRMGQLALDMLSLAHKAVQEKDPSLAHEVHLSDDAVDSLYLALHKELMDKMRAHPEYVEQASHFSLIARHLERVADHAVNIAEMTIYMLEGDHRPFRRPPREGEAAHEKT